MKLQVIVGLPTSATATLLNITRPPREAVEARFTPVLENRLSDELEMEGVKAYLV
jgi:hypothetical protein